VQYAYVKENLSAGTLVAPFDIKVKGTKGYYLGWSSSKPVSVALALFKDWVLEEALPKD
jgi:DNA-binding transcriptional LysR family regulator